MPDYVRVLRVRNKVKMKYRKLYERGSKLSGLFWPDLSPSNCSTFSVPRVLDELGPCNFELTANEHWKSTPDPVNFIHYSMWPPRFLVICRCILNTTMNNKAPVHWNYIVLLSVMISKYVASSLNKSSNSQWVLDHTLLNVQFWSCTWRNWTVVREGNAPFPGSKAEPGVEAGPNTRHLAWPLCVIFHLMTVWYGSNPN